jgi:hypothetical protein
LVYHATDGGIRFASKIVVESEMLDLVNAGWEVVKELSGSRYLVRMEVRRV